MALTMLRPVQRKRLFETRRLGAGSRFTFRSEKSKELPSFLFEKAIGSPHFSALAAASNPSGGDEERAGYAKFSGTGKSLPKIR